MTWLNLIKRMAGALNAKPRSDPIDSIPVGGGDSNERQFYVHGVPHLLRDEGDRVVHFVGDFEHRLQRTPYGDKLLPEVFPRWMKLREHPGVSLERVAASVIQDAAQSAAPQRTHANSAEAEPRRQQSPGRCATDAKCGGRQEGEGTDAGGMATERASSSAYTVGELIEWGEMTFPNCKPGGARTYTSFAVRLSTIAGEKILQGEGLKGALAESGCKTGDQVAVKKLCKEKVPAFDKKTGYPIKDPKTGEQKLWDRWVWTINHVH
ncbi:hypothetical protein [Cupriavidus necator]